MKAKSITGNSPEEIKNALQQNMADGFKPTLAIVFISIKQDRKAICEILSREGIDVFGATSCGEFINGYQSEGEIVILLLDIHRSNFTILFETIYDRTLKDAASQLAQAALEKFDNPALLVCSTGMTTKGEYFDGETFVRSLEYNFGPDKIFFGGMAGDDWTFSGTYVFTNQQETDLGMVALVINMDNVSLGGMAITGWKPMGLSRKVTKSKGTLLYTIDDKPAIEMYFKYLGKMEKLEDKDFNMLKSSPFTIRLSLKKSREKRCCVLR